MPTVTAINELSAAVIPLLWKASWQGGLALLLVLGISRVMRKIPAHIQCWLWRLAFLKLLIVGVWFIPVELHWLPSVESTVIANPPVSSESIPVQLPAQTDMAASALPSDHGWPAPPLEAIPSLSGLSFLLFAWMAGMILFLAKLLRHWAHILKMTVNLETPTDKRLLNSVAEISRLMGMRRQPRLRISRNSDSPCLVGVVRPVIVLPSIVLESCSADELNAALIHELAHVKRRDLFWNWLPTIAQVVFFFHPLVWLTNREWRLAQEIATDELAVAALGVNVAQYGQSLVNLAAMCPRVTIRPQLVVPLNESYSQLRRRVIAMQTFRTLTGHRRLAMAAVVLAIAVFGVVPWKLTTRKVQAQAVAAAEQENATDGNVAATAKHLTTNNVQLADRDAPPQRQLLYRQQAAEKKAVAEFNGTWNVRHMINNGVKKPIAPDDHYHWFFDAATKTVSTNWKLGDNTGIDNKQGLKDSFIVNPSTHPKQVTIYGRRTLLQAIYEIDGDDLKIAIYGRSEFDRPDSIEFDKVRKNGSAFVVFVLRKMDVPKEK